MIKLLIEHLIFKYFVQREVLKYSIIIIIQISITIIAVENHYSISNLLQKGNSFSFHHVPVFLTLYVTALIASDSFICGLYVLKANGVTSIVQNGILSKASNHVVFEFATIQFRSRARGLDMKDSYIVARSPFVAKQNPRRDSIGKVQYRDYIAE